VFPGQAQKRFKQTSIRKAEMSTQSVKTQNTIFLFQSEPAGANICQCLLLSYLLTFEFVKSDKYRSI